MDEPNTNPHEGHRERLRQRYRQYGLDGFTDHEVLELLLGYTILQKDTNEPAHELIRQFGDLRIVLDSTEEELSRIENVGASSAFFLTLIRDVARRYVEQTKSDPLRLLEPREAIEYFIPFFIGRKKECVFAAFLNEQKKVIDTAMVFNGAIDAVLFQTKVLVKEARKRACRYVVLAHNHFTDAVPSLEDIAATRAAREALLDYNIGVSDHIVVCGGIASSMQETGHFAQTRPFPKK